MKLEVLANSATTIWLPGGKLDVFSTATPFAMGTEVDVAPIRNNTVPAGAVVPGTTGFAVNVNATCWPGSTALAEVVSVPVTGAGKTLRVTFVVAISYVVVSVGVNVTERVCVPASKTVPAGGLYAN